MTTKRLRAAESIIELALDLAKEFEQAEYNKRIALILRRHKVALEDSAQARWIAVSERLPEDWAIVVIGGYVQRIVARVNGECWEWADESADWAMLDAVTHWQPLPDAPEGDQG